MRFKRRKYAGGYIIPPTKFSLRKRRFEAAREVFEKPMIRFRKALLSAPGAKLLDLRIRRRRKKMVALVIMSMFMYMLAANIREVYFNKEEE